MGKQQRNRKKPILDYLVGTYGLKLANKKEIK